MQPAKLQPKSRDAVTRKEVAPSAPTGWWKNLRLRARENIFDRIAALFRYAKLLGPANGFRALLYTFHRAKIDEDGLKPEPTDPRSVGALTSAETIPGGARFTFTHAVLEVLFLDGGGVFVGWDDARPVPSYAIGAFTAQSPGPALVSDARLTKDGTGWLLSTDELTVAVGNIGSLTFKGQQNKAIRQDASPAWTGNAWSLTTLLDSDAAVVGLGGRASGLDRAGHTYRLWNTDPGGTYTVSDDPLSMSIPVYQVVSNAGCHLAFFDNSYNGTVEVGEQLVLDLQGGPLRYYVFSGTPESNLARYTKLTGRPALPPRWALGFHQCRWGYGSEQVVREIVEKFDHHDLPLAALWLDIDHSIEARPFTIDKKRYPDLEGLSAEFQAKGIHLVVIVDPGVGKDRNDATYVSGKKHDVFCKDVNGDVIRGVVWPGWTVFPDFTAEQVRDWWGARYKQYLDFGIDGFWHDMNEPSVFTIWGDGTLPLSAQHDFDGRGGNHKAGHNLYALLLNHAGYHGVREIRPSKRPFLLTRSGFAGIQRYAGTWSGDIGTSWEGLGLSLTFTLGLGLCGMPFSGPDIGGFDLHPSNELYVRWFQLGAYLPFFRVHSAADLPAREPWELGDEVLGQIRPAMRQRTELLPYWYSLAWKAHRTGTPYVRPMFWADPADATLRWEESQFLLGDSLLVAPILKEGAVERKVRLPRGRWYDRKTGVVHEGPGQLTVSAPLDTIPVFVREGSVIPVERDGSISLEVYAGNGSGGFLIRDEGDGYADPVEEHFTVDGPFPYPVKKIGF